MKIWLELRVGKIAKGKPFELGEIASYDALTEEAAKGINSLIRAKKTSAEPQSETGLSLKNEPCEVWAHIGGNGISLYNVFRYGLEENGINLLHLDSTGATMKAHLKRDDFSDDIDAKNLAEIENTGEAARLTFEILRSLLD